MTEIGRASISKNLKLPANGSAPSWIKLQIKYNIFRNITPELGATMVNDYKSFYNDKSRRRSAWLVKKGASLSEISEKNITRLIKAASALSLAFDGNIGDNEKALVLYHLARMKYQIGVSGSLYDKNMGEKTMNAIRAELLKDARQDIENAVKLIENGAVLPKMINAQAITLLSSMKGITRA